MSRAREAFSDLAGTLATGITFWGLIGFWLVVFRLVGVIGTPWLWVLAPFWIPWAWVAILVIIIVIGDRPAEPWSPPLYAKDIHWS